ncbi:MAG: V-type ATPase subunit [Vicinamibacterales bacterium]
MGRCDYANARVRAMKGRLLGGSGIAELLAQPGLAARLEYLNASAYGTWIARYQAGEQDLLRGAERGLAACAADDIVRIDRFLQGGTAQSVFRAVLALEEGWTLKTLIRSIAHGVPSERILTLIAPTPEFDDSSLRELARQSDVRSLVDLLITWRSPFALPLSTALRRATTDFELFAVEIALDRFLFARALESARRGREDRAWLCAFLERQIDLGNAATLLKRQGVACGEDLFIPGGRLLSLRRFQQFSLLHPRELRIALAKDMSLRLDAGLTATVSGADPVRVDQILQKALRDGIREQARINPLSLAVPLSFVLERRAEIQRIRLALRGTEFGLPAQELAALTEGA